MAAVYTEDEVKCVLNKLLKRVNASRKVYDLDALTVEEIALAIEAEMHGLIRTVESNSYARGVRMTEEKHKNNKR